MMKPIEIAVLPAISYPPGRVKGGRVLTVNEYYGGRLKSIGLQDREGLLTSGSMESGEVEFSTSSRERMTVMTGSLTIRRPGDAAWATVRRGESFDVPAHVSFHVKADEPTAYLCRYG